MSRRPGYRRHGSKSARYRRPNPDKKPLGDPNDKSRLKREAEAEARAAAPARKKNPFED